MKIKLTIGIPIYNGEETIAETLNSIFSQITPEVEVVVSDNASTDGTRRIVEMYCEKYSQLKYHRNENNMGADKNIDLVVNRATGTYVWLMGDDDEISSGGVAYIIGIIDAHPDLAAIFVNYCLYDRMTGQCVNERVLKIKQDVLCRTADSFLATATVYPNFMSSIVVRKTRWMATDTAAYAGTHWLQYGALMKIIEGDNSFCVATPYVINRGLDSHSPNEANRNGVAISVLMNLIDIVDALPRSIFSRETIAKARAEAYKYLPRKIFSAKRHGLRLNVALISRMIKTFGYYGGFWIRDFPLMLLPRYFHYWAWRLFRTKTIHLFFITINKLY
jgi:glycosyltransferase involved in cell wall biosynthesis